MEKETILLLHGWGQNKEAWESIRPLLEQNFKVIALDLPGFGKEKKPSSNWTIQNYSQWLVKKVETLEIKNLILIGFSFGGRIAAYTASRNPKWLKGLVLIGTPGLYRPTIKTKLKIGAYKTYKKFLPKSVLSKTLSKEDISARSSNLGEIRYNAITFDQTKYLPQIKVPTIIIAGKHDEQVSLKISEEMNDLIENSKLEVFNTNHYIFNKKPLLVYGKIKTFIKNL